MSHGRHAARYDPDAFPRVGVTVDIAVVTIANDRLQVVLIQRGGDPYAGAWALPGGFIQPDETLDEAATRELREETSIAAAGHLEQVHAYGDAGRDPRMRVVTVVYLAVMAQMPRVAAGSDAHGAALVPIDDVIGPRVDAAYRLAFDHERILRDIVERARSKLETTPLAMAFVGDEFTLSQLRHVYEAVWGRALDPGCFRRSVLGVAGFVTPTGGRAADGHGDGRSAPTYRSGGALRLDPPLRRADFWS